MSEPSRTGYIFAGWYTGESVNDGIFTTTDRVWADMTLVARWNPAKLTVTFLDYYGDVLERQSVDYGTAATAPAVPTTVTTQGGILQFVGWDTAFGTVTSDLTVQAKYSADLYTVKFVADGCDAIDDVVICAGLLPSKPADPEKEGFIFVGWYLDREFNEEYAFDRALNEDTTLYACFREKGEYTLVSTAEDLIAIADDPAGKYILANDINLKGESWTPIDSFSGTLDGAGHKIFNFVISESAQYVGFIRKNSGTIKDLTFDDFIFTTNRNNGGNNYIGVIAAYNSGSIVNCSLSNESMNVSCTNPSEKNSGNYYVGTVCGCNEASGVVERVQATITVDAYASANGGTYSGVLGEYPSKVYFYLGIVGLNNGVTNDCDYQGEVTIKASKKNNYSYTYLNVGGIVGQNNESGTVARCSSKLALHSTYTANMSVSNLGALVGRNCGKVSESTAVGTIRQEGKGDSKLGGIAGRSVNGGSIYACYADVDITLTNSSGSRYIGGLVGYNEGNASAKMSVCTGSITADALTGYGYVIGGMADGSTCFKCYYSSDATIVIADEQVTDVTCAEGVAKTLAECGSRELLFDTLCWDETVWTIVDGCPTLKRD